MNLLSDAISDIFGTLSLQRDSLLIQMRAICLQAIIFSVRTRIQAIWIQWKWRKRISAALANPGDSKSIKSWLIRSGNRDSAAQIRYQPHQARSFLLVMLVSGLYSLSVTEQKLIIGIKQPMLSLLMEVTLSTPEY